MTIVSLNTSVIDLGATMPQPASDTLAEPVERRVRFEPVPAQRSIVERAYGTSPVRIVPMRRARRSWFRRLATRKAHA
jgi:hypothetical protein